MNKHTTKGRQFHKDAFGIDCLYWDDLTDEEKDQVTETYLCIRETECGYGRDTPEFLEENPGEIGEGVKCCRFYIPYDETLAQTGYLEVDI